MIRWGWKRFLWANCIDRRTAVCVWVAKLFNETLRPLRPMWMLFTVAIRSSPEPGAEKDGNTTTIYLWIIPFPSFFIKKKNTQKSSNPIEKKTPDVRVLFFKNKELNGFVFHIYRTCLCVYFPFFLCLFFSNPHHVTIDPI